MPCTFVIQGRIRQTQNFGRDVVFSADLCYNGANKKPPLCKGSLGMRSFIFRGMGFALCLCNTKAKLAIKQNDKQEIVDQIGEKYHERYVCSKMLISIKVL